MVKKFITNPALISRKPEISKVVKVTSTQRTTQTGNVIRKNNRSVPLNPQGSRNAPRSGNFATKRKMNKRIG